MQTKNHNINSSYALKLENNELLFYDTLEEVADAAYDLGLTDLQVQVKVMRVRFDQLSENQSCFVRGYIGGIKKTKNIHGDTPGKADK